MFTGIIEAVGHIAEITPQAGDIRLRVATEKLDLDDVNLGDSIAVNGVCLTVVGLPGDGFYADVSNETVSLTNVQYFRIGTAVNLEKAMLPTTRLGGHLVSGHVDGVGRVIDRRIDGRSVRFTIEAPKSLARYIAKKGSICIDGVSLTVNELAGQQFFLNIVPHTLQQTIIDQYQAGTLVHLEVDVIARYLERLLLADKAENTGIDMNFLAEHGFIK